MNFLQQLGAVWGKIGVVQRVLLLTILLACIGMGVFLTHWATRPEMQVLYSNLDPSDAGQITEKISEAQVPYELGNGGTTIYVPRQHVHELRLTMAKEGLPGSKQNGYDIFENEKLGVSPMVQQLNKKRAMEEELAKTIQMIDGVEYTKVMLVLPEQTLFTTEPEQAKASVMVKLRAGWRLNPSNVAAITHLVANGVDGLHAENVTISDSQGRMLTNAMGDDSSVTAANTFMDYKQRVEETIAEKVRNLLETVLGPGRCSVKVSAVLDMTMEERMVKEYDKGMPSEETINSTTKSVTNTPGEEQTVAGQDTMEKEETVETKMMVPETMIKSIKTPGDILSLSVAAMVDLKKEVEPAGGAVPGEEGAEEAPAAPAEPQFVEMMSIDDVKNIIRNAVGPELLKGESALTVVNVPFERPKAPLMAAEPEVDKFERILEIIRQSSTGLLSICALVVLWIFTRAFNKPAKEHTKEEEETDLVKMGLLPAGDGTTDPVIAVRQHIAGRFRENPDEVKQLFASWLQEDA